MGAIFSKDTGLWALVALGIMFLFLGRLLPKAIVDRIVNDQKERIEFLESALAREQELNNVRTKQMEKLLTYAEAADKVLEALQKSSKEAA